MTDQIFYITWWRHQMETSSALLAFCAGNSPVTGEFPSQRPVTLSFDVFFDLWLNKRLSKQSWGRWLEMPSCSLWHHCNEFTCAKNLMHYNWLVSQMWAPLAACREPAGKLRQLYKVLYVFEHKMQYLLIHVPFSRIVVFWHIGNVPPTIS